MSTTQSTATRAIMMRDGYSIPSTADQRTELNDLPICEMMYAKRNGGRVCRATLAAVFEAMRDSNAVVVLYVGADGKQDARVLWPNSVTLTKDDNIVCCAYCTMRRQWKSFRLDRMITCHPLSMPDDILTDDEPHQDWEDSPQGRAIAAR
jgi:predicted DNA-binding transcriptional regulator YafY